MKNVFIQCLTGNRSFTARSLVPCVTVIQTNICTSHWFRLVLKYFPLSGVTIIHDTFCCHGMWVYVWMLACVCVCMCAYVCDSVCLCVIESVYVVFNWRTAVFRESHMSSLDHPSAQYAMQDMNQFAWTSTQLAWPPSTAFDWREGGPSSQGRVPGSGLGVCL